MVVIGTSISENTERTQEFINNLITEVGVSDWEIARCRMPKTYKCFMNFEYIYK